MRKLEHKLGEKKILYSQLSDQYFLPPRDSRGVTKTYLDKVKVGTVFRVETLTLKRFHAELRPSQLKRSLYTCKFEAYSKINTILVERGAPDLGFEEAHMPDGTWLYKIARYLDQTNLCGLFEIALHPVGDGQTATERLYRAQKRAEKAMLTDNGLGKREDIKASLDDLQQTYKRLISRQAELANLTTYMRVLKQQVSRDNENLEKQLARTALVVYQVGNDLSAEEALQNNGQDKQLIYDTLRFIQATDCVLDRSETTGTMASKYSY
jgi:hypothetical protein